MSFSKRYQLKELIGVGGMGQVYRAFDRLTGQFVALKAVTVPGESLDFTSRIKAQSSGPEDLHLALANEFRVLSSLRHPHIVSVLDYGFDGANQPYFTMDLLEKARPLDRAARLVPVRERLRFMMQLLQALAYLHRHGIIHRDLKPGNVLVRDDQVKVLDFGLAVEHRQDAEGMVGTPAYVAPEILTGQAASEAADIYCAGVLAYEILAGEHPFQRLDEGMTGLMRRVILGQADMSKLPVEEDVRHVIGTMMTKRPQDRFESAQVALEALQLALSMTVEKDAPAQRESFLQAAQFIGREAELALLVESLDGAIRGQGSAWLVAGESGVGKTRLLEELRAAALVKGMLVLRGRAPAEGGGHYALLRDVMRYLTLVVALDEEEAGVLQMLVPDIARLTGMSVPDITMLDPQMTQRRLIRIMEQVFRRIEQPILILLEDLQRANESLTPVGHLSRIVSDLPVVIVGSYREEETPHLAESLPAMQVIRLTGFDGPTTEQLMVSILGETTGRLPELVTLVHSETEGNPFFVIEVLRALAESTGRLGGIGVGDLPEHVFSQGIQEIVQTRLKRLPPEFHPVLWFAAAAGRDIDFALLKHVDAAIDYEEWLVHCSDAALLELVGGIWSFTHEKVREGILYPLDEAQRQRLSRQAAEAVESVYGVSHETAALLAHHYGQAGEFALALRYATQVVVEFTGSGALQEAVNYGLNALRLVGMNPERENLDSIKQEMQRIQDMLQSRSRDEWLNLSPVSAADKTEAALIELLMMLQTPARMLGRVKLYSFFILRAMALTLVHGSTPVTPLVYVTFGMLYHNMTGSVRTAYLSSHLGVMMSGQGNRAFAAPVYYFHTAYLSLWMNPLVDTLVISVEGARIGFEQGDGLYAALNLMMVDRVIAASGFPLDEVIQSAAQHLERIRDHASIAAFHCLLEMQFAKALAGQTELSTSLSDETTDEERDMVAVLPAAGQSQAAVYYLKKLMLHYYFGDYAVALHYADRVTRLLDTLEGQPGQVEFTLFHALALAAEIGGVPDEVQQFVIQAYADMLEQWAALCKANFEHKALLVRAELARLQNAENALALYQAAADSAEQHGFTQYVALSCELAAQFCEQSGRRVEPYFTRAMVAWKRLGAEAKVRQMQG